MPETGFWFTSRPKTCLPIEAFEQDNGCAALASNYKKIYNFSVIALSCVPIPAVYLLNSNIRCFLQFGKLGALCGLSWIHLGVWDRLAVRIQTINALGRRSRLSSTVLDAHATVSVVARIISIHLGMGTKYARIFSSAQESADMKHRVFPGA